MFYCAASTAGRSFSEGRGLFESKTLSTFFLYMIRHNIVICIHNDVPTGKY